MLRLKRIRKTKDGQEVKHQDHSRCTITCGCCGKREHCEDECHINAANAKNKRKLKRNAVRTPVRVVHLRGGGLTLEVLRVRVTLVENEGPHPPPTGGRGPPNPKPKGET